MIYKNPKIHPTNLVPKWNNPNLSVVRAEDGNTTQITFNPSSGNNREFDCYEVLANDQVIATLQSGDTLQYSHDTRDGGPFTYSVKGIISLSLHKVTNEVVVPSVPPPPTVEMERSGLDLTFRLIPNEVEGESSHFHSMNISGVGHNLVGGQPVYEITKTAQISAYMNLKGVSENAIGFSQWSNTVGLHTPHHKVRPTLTLTEGSSPGEITLTSTDTEVVWSNPDFANGSDPTLRYVFYIEDSNSGVTTHKVAENSFTTTLPSGSYSFKAHTIKDVGYSWESNIVTHTV